MTEPTPPARPGRPRSSSASTIEEAAGELFLEQGYGRTSMEQIAQRAGVSRATVFNYVTAKSDLLWVAVDEALDELERELGGGVPVPRALRGVAARSTSARIPLAVGQSSIMQADDELLTSGMLRLARLATLIRDGLEPGTDPLARAVAASALAGATAAAWRAWAAAGTGRAPLLDYVDRALAHLGPVVPRDTVE